MANKKNKFRRFFRKFNWFFGVYLMPRHDATIMTQNGLLSFDSRDRTLGRSLCVEREFEIDGMQETLRLLQNEGYMANDLSNATVLDVGGYIGMISVGFLHNNMFGHAVAFEPNPNNFRLLQKNIEQNNLQNHLVAYNMALSNCREELMMELSDKNYGDHRIRESGHDVEEDHYGESRRSTITVEANKLDEVMMTSESSRADSVALVWMDIQGHEGKFFGGAKQFFSQHKNVPVAMEFWPYGIRRSGMEKEEFCGLLKEMFSKFYILYESTPIARDIENIDAYFEQYSAPDSGCHMILVNDKI